MPTPSLHSLLKRCSSPCNHIFACTCLTQSSFIEGKEGRKEERCSLECIDKIYCFPCLEMLATFGPIQGHILPWVNRWRYFVTIEKRVFSTDYTLIRGCIWMTGVEPFSLKPYVSIFHGEEQIFRDLHNWEISAFTILVPFRHVGLKSFHKGWQW